MLTIQLLLMETILMASKSLSHTRVAYRLYNTCCSLCYNGFLFVTTLFPVFLVVFLFR